MKALPFFFVLFAMPLTYSQTQLVNDVMTFGGTQTETSSGTLGEQLIFNDFNNKFLILSGFQQGQLGQLGTGLREFPESVKIGIYPNPTSHVLWIDVESDLATKMSASLHDTEGRMVKTIDIRNHKKNTVDVDALPSGAYLLLLVDDHNHFYQKIILIQ